jgi:hypothetical protein
VSYIDKNSNIVMSLNMTNEGRRLLSLGKLTFDTFRLGDSEIDYTTLGPTYDITLENVIRAKPLNPDIKTPLFPTPTSTSSFLAVPNLSEVIVQTLTNAPRIGFFEYGTGTTIEYTAYTDTICHVLQADAIIPISGTTGGTSVSVYQAPTYGSNTYEPKIGDLMLVKMTNDELVATQNQAVVELNTPVPYLWYQVQGVTGSLSANTLQVEIDRDFASFPNYTGPNYCWTTFYPLGSGSSKDYLFSDGGFFSGGCVWNLNNVWSYPIPGVNPLTHETYNNYGSESYVGSKEYFGYTSEIPLTFSANPACHLVPSISIIHYTNKETCDNTSELKYGQSFYVDTTIPESPKLIMPTLMWHRSTTGSTIGYVFSATSSGTSQFVTLSGNNTTIEYYPLVDGYNVSVGRLFPELQMFTIDDQELVAALSYKANRNWTLPTVGASVVSNTDGIIDSTENLYLTYLLKSNSGYTTSLHCQNIICVNFPAINCPPTIRQAVEVQFPLGQLPYMMVTGGTGWYSDEFYILAQRQPLGTYPDPTQWTLMNYTSGITNHIAGNRIDPTNLESTTFLVTNTDYINGATYDLSNFIKIPQIAETDYLQFGDERFFFGNVEATALRTRYRTQFVITVPPNLYNTSINPTWANSNQRVHITDLGIYDVNKNLVAMGKFNLPIDKVPNVTLILQATIDI